MPEHRPDELFDVVDEEDQVIGQAHRSVVHAQQLLHRAVHVFLFNSRGELLIQHRSATKDEFPLCLTSSASGHVDSGESYAQAAIRELREELGLQCDLEYLAKFPASPMMAFEHSMLYRAETDQPPTLDPAEILDGWFMPVGEVLREMDAEPARFTPVFRVLFRWYWNRYGL